MWILIYVILFMAAVAVAELVDYYLPEVIFKIVLFILTVTYGVALVFCIVKSVEVSNSPESSVVEELYDIYSLRDESGTNGNFFMGTGTISNDVYYVVLVKDSIGYYQEVLEGRVYIIESDEETPRVVQVSYYRYNQSYSELFNFNKTQDSHYIVYVPVGTIIINYSIE